MIGNADYLANNADFVLAVKSVLSGLAIVVITIAVYLLFKKNKSYSWVFAFFIFLVIFTVSSLLLSSALQISLNESSF